MQDLNIPELNKMLNSVKQYFANNTRKNYNDAFEATKQFVAYIERNQPPPQPLQYAYNSEQYINAYCNFVEMQKCKYNNVLTYTEQQAQQTIIKKWFADNVQLATDNVLYWTANGDRRIYMATLPTPITNHSSTTATTEKIFSNNDYEQYKKQRLLESTTS